MNAKTFEKELLKTISSIGIGRKQRTHLLETAEEVEIDTQDYMRIRAKVFDLAQDQGVDSFSWLEDAMKILDRAKAITYTSIAYFSPENSGRDELRNLLLQAKKSIWACIFTISDNDLANALIQRSRSGLDVKVISDDQKLHDTGSDIFRLKEEGVLVKIDDTRHHMHHKFAIVDGETIINGSYNWTRSADEYNHENLIVTRDEALVRAFSNEFRSLWDEFSLL